MNQLLRALVAEKVLKKAYFDVPRTLYEICAATPYKGLGLIVARSAAFNSTSQSQIEHPPSANGNILKRSNLPYIISSVKLAKNLKDGSVYVQNDLPSGSSLKGFLVPKKEALDSWRILGRECPPVDLLRYSRK